MKILLKIISLFCLFGVLLACTGKDDVITEEEIVLKENATVIYVVRHAEKATNDPVNPDLSAAGQQRAIVLKDSLSKVLLSAIYTTNYKRTQQTAAPIAQAKNITPQLYSDLNALAAKVKQDNLNQTVLIVGHSNTVLEIIEAFKAKRPIATVNDSEYNYMFRITLKENKDPEVEVKRYGN